MIALKSYQGLKGCLYALVASERGLFEFEGTVVELLSVNMVGEKIIDVRWSVWPSSTEVVDLDAIKHFALTPRGES